jgi:hypothetical protein
MFMLVDSTLKVISHSDIESACIAGDDVNIVRHKRSILNNEKEWERKKTDPSARLRAKSNEEGGF